MQIQTSNSAWKAGPGQLAGAVSGANSIAFWESLVSEVLETAKQMGEILSNVSKTRSEISMTFARNARA
jgi:hypothetical protein